MRKSFFILLFLLILPLCCFADTVSKYEGTWMHYQVTGAQSRQYVIYELCDNHKAYFSRETFQNDGTSSVETGVYTWVDSGSTVLIMDGSDVFKELYYVDDTRLSSSSYKNSNFYFRVLQFGEDVESLYSSINVDVNMDPRGKWSYYQGSTNLHNVIFNGSSGVLSFDLYIYDDGSIYLSQAYMKKDHSGLYFGNLSGIWIGDYNDMSFLIDNEAYKAWISDDGVLHVRFPSENVYDFIHVEKIKSGR